MYLCCLCNDTNTGLKCLLVIPFHDLDYNCLIHVHLKQGCMFMQMMLCTCLSSITLDATAKWRFFILRPRTHSCTLKQLPTHCSTGTDSILSMNCNTTIDLWWLCPFILASNLSSSVNDIVAIGPESFYATNDRFYHSHSSWVSPGVMSFTALQMWGWWLLVLCLQMVSTYHLTKGI